VCNSIVENVAKSAGLNVGIEMPDRLVVDQEIKNTMVIRDWILLKSWG